MNQRDKLHSQELYLPMDDSIMAEQLLCLEKQYDYNATRPLEGEKRAALLKEMFAEIVKVVNTVEIENKTEMVKFLEHEIELLNRKSSKTGPTKAQLENEKLAEELYEALSTMTEPVTISEFQEKSVYPIASKSNQKLTSLMKKLICGAEKHLSIFGMKVAMTPKKLPLHNQI